MLSLKVCISVCSVAQSLIIRARFLTSANVYSTICFKSCRKEQNDKLKSRYVYITDVFTWCNHLLIYIWKSQSSQHYAFGEGKAFVRYCECSIWFAICLCSYRNGILQKNNLYCSFQNEAERLSPLEFFSTLWKCWTFSTQTLVIRVSLHRMKTMCF